MSIALSQARLNWKTLPIFLLVCYLVLSFGALFQPGDWYAGLRLAPWNPPNIAFPIVWSILYTLIAIAGCLIFSTQKPLLKILWVAQLLLNSAWSWIFFDQHWVAIALVEILILMLVIAFLLIVAFRENLKIVCYLLAPYFIWICLATTLNAYILIYN